MPRLIISLLITACIVNCSCKNYTHLNYAFISDTTQIKSDMDSIIKTTGYRNYQNIDALNYTADYIKRQFLLITDSIFEQSYEANGKHYKNIIASINTDKKERIIIGAHYDVCGNQDGADDNASGVVGLLELARLLKEEPLNYRVDFVAYTLEEPPYFGTDDMGSNVHAKYLHDNNITVKGMICLEMIGYFSDMKNSQNYPAGILKWFYGNKGDFVTVIQKFGNGSFGNEIKRKMKQKKMIKTKSFKGPKSMPGIDFSDHRNYWKYGYSAVMITNTAFYRNYNYHQKTDTIGTIDFKRLALTIDELFLALKQFK
jgi:hypothetical protein